MTEENEIKKEETTVPASPSQKDVVTSVSDKIEQFIADVPLSAPVPSLPIKRQLALISTMVFAIFAIGGVPLVADHLREGSGTESTAPATEGSETETAETGPIDPFENFSVTAGSALVYDIKRERLLYEKNPDERRPLASITKLMTALVAHEIMDGGLIVPITNEAIGQSGDSGLKEGERFTLDNLSDLILLTSSNDGAFALAAAAGRALDESDPASAFVKAMNVRAKELGLTKTSFRNPTGLDISEEEAGAYGSARDVATLLKYIFENERQILEETAEAAAEFNDLSGIRHDADNTNPVVDAIPGLIGSKTGYTTLSGGNLAVIFDAGVDRPIVVVVLSSSHSGRFGDVLRLVEAAREKLKSEE